MGEKRDGQTQLLTKDIFSEMLEGEAFDDIKDFMIDRNLLKTAFPGASDERIKAEREYQASYYVMKKFLNPEKCDTVKENKISDALGLATGED